MPHKVSNCILHIGFLRFADTTWGLAFGLTRSVKRSVKTAYCNFPVPLFFYKFVLIELPWQLSHQPFMNTLPLMSSPLSIPLSLSLKYMFVTVELAFEFG